MRQQVIIRLQLYLCQPQLLTFTQHWLKTWNVEESDNCEHMYNHINIPCTADQNLVIQPTLGQKVWFRFIYFCFMHFRMYTSHVIIICESNWFCVGWGSQNTQSLIRFVVLSNIMAKKLKRFYCPHIGKITSFICVFNMICD
jgi:hypothetical protein